jgi:hypothetical protein
MREGRSIHGVDDARETKNVSLRRHDGRAEARVHIGIADGLVIKSYLSSEVYMPWWVQLVVALGAVLGLVCLGVIAKGIFALRDAISSLEKSIEQIKPQSLADLIARIPFW